MKLLVRDLEIILEQLKLLEVSKLNVTSLKVGDHTIHLIRHEEQKDGVWYVITDIT